MTKTTRPPRHQWASPQEWLLEKINEENNRETLRGYIRELLGHADADGVQDSFQSDMDADGYFQDLNLCPDCQTTLTDRTTSGEHPSYCDECDREVDLP